MRVPKWLAVVGFNFSATFFVGLALYGLARYMTEGLQQSDSLVESVLYAAVTLLCVAGIYFFGKEKDRHKADEARQSVPPARVSPGKPKR